MITAPLFTSRLGRAEVLAIVKDARKLGSFGDWFLPFLVPTASVEELELSVRSHTCLEKLRRYGAIKQLADLSTLTVNELLKVKNFGRKSIVDLFGAIEPLIIDGRTDAGCSSEVTTGIQLSREANRLATAPSSKRIRCNDPRLKHHLSSLLSAANSVPGCTALSTNATLEEVALRIATQVSKTKLTFEIKQVRTLIARISRKPLETELREVVGCFVSDRNLEIVLDYLGWKGSAPMTLQAVGERYGVTRERVRQIVERRTKSLKRYRIYLPALDRALKAINRLLPAPKEAIQSAFLRTKCCRTDFALESVGTAADFFGKPVRFVLDTQSGITMALRKDDAGLLRLIRSAAVRSASKYGMSNVMELADAINQNCCLGLNSSVVEMVVRRLPSFDDLGGGWFWIKDNSRNHLFTVIRKVLSVTEGVHISEIRSAIASDARGFGFAPPKEVVSQFCRRALHCEIEDEIVVPKASYESADTLSPSELIMFNVLRKHGPLLHRVDFQRLCLQKGLNHSTFNIYLGRNAILRRYAPSVYGLRGATFSQEYLSNARKKRQETFKDYGWLANGQPWFVSQLGSATVSTGIMHIPSSLRQQLVGTYNMMTADKEHMGRFVVADNGAWGLGSFFRRRGGDVGDFLLLRFNLKDHAVEVEIGDETVVPESEVALTEEIVDS